MKTLFLGLILLAGCAQHKQAPTACYKLEVCPTSFEGGGIFRQSVNVNILCIYGYDTSGNKNGEVQRFLSNDALVAWAQSHPEAKGCEK